MKNIEIITTTADQLYEIANDLIKNAKTINGVTRTGYCINVNIKSLPIMNKEQRLLINTKEDDTGIVFIDIKNIDVNEMN